ncbi:CRISPR-associated protein Csy1 [bioreactor metagenome]|uniref:CRISPR-associated protein Csy1 n=1 Tax=bioreactor metagenome TaxID=1076179 RepID=A0A644Y2I1_9ZZZZ
MSEASVTGSKAGFRTAIDSFLQDRMQAKLDKLKPDDPQRDEVSASFARDVWIASAAKRVEQIQAVTHSLKPIHPDARGTNLYVAPADLPTLNELGSHVLGTAFASDVVGNAAALDVYKFLKVEANGRSLLSALLAEDDAALQALHDDADQAKALRDAFVSLTQPRTGSASSHSRAKQLYWLTGGDASNDADFELLAPLFATSLAHSVHGELQEHRFGEPNKLARAARRERKAHDDVYYDYPGLAVQKMGGTKPQNISQLNSERGGVNYLLSSLPPEWTPNEKRLPVHAKSVFDKLFISRPEVRKTVRTLREFLESNPDPNMDTRNQRDALVDVLVDELVTMAGELQQMEPGWTLRDERFQDLVMEEKLWLDPSRAEAPSESEFAEQWMLMNWPEQIGERFARWLNAKLADKLPMGDVEAREWKRALLVYDDGFANHLHALRKSFPASSNSEGGATL